MVQSQLDGVAARWERVDGDPPTPVLLDQQELKSVKSQWEREEGVDGENPLLVNSTI